MYTHEQLNNAVNNALEAQAARMEELENENNRQAQRINHQDQRIENVAFRYEAMFGMDALYRQAFPERVPSSHASTG